MYWRSVNLQLNFLNFKYAIRKHACYPAATVHNHPKRLIQAERCSVFSSIRSPHTDSRKVLTTRQAGFGWWWRRRSVKTCQVWIGAILSTRSQTARTICLRSVFSKCVRSVVSHAVRTAGVIGNRFLKLDLIVWNKRVAENWWRKCDVFRTATIERLFI